MAKVQNIIVDIPEKEEDLKKIIKAAHADSKGVMSRYNETNLKKDITKASSAGVDFINTKEFRSLTFRQGAANNFPEVSLLNKGQLKNKVKDIDKDEESKDEEKEDVRPELLSHFKKVVRGDLLRYIMLANTRQLEICAWEQDDPDFKTAVTRLFATDMAWRGAYANSGDDYKRIETMVLLFIKTFRGGLHTSGEWKQEGLIEFKPILCLCFGLGDPCSPRCGHFHVDIFDPRQECAHDSGSKYEKDNQKHSLQQMKFLHSTLLSLAKAGGKRCLVCPDGTGDQVELTALDKDADYATYLAQVETHLNSHGKLNNCLNGFILWEAVGVFNNKINLDFAKACSVLNSIANRDKYRDQVTGLVLKEPDNLPIRKLAAIAHLVKSLFIVNDKSYTNNKGEVVFNQSVLSAGD